MSETIDQRMARRRNSLRTAKTEAEHEAYFAAHRAMELGLVRAAEIALGNLLTNPSPAALQTANNCVRAVSEFHVELHTYAREHFSSMYAEMPWAAIEQSSKDSEHVGRALYELESMIKRLQLRPAK
jgi:hypothetical protein